MPEQPRLQLLSAQYACPVGSQLRRAQPRALGVHQGRTRLPVAPQPAHFALLTRISPQIMVSRASTALWGRSQWRLALLANPLARRSPQHRR